MMELTLFTLLNGVNRHFATMSKTLSKILRQLVASKVIRYALAYLVCFQIMTQVSDLDFEVEFIA